MNNKKYMFSIFFHLLGLALLEILFYFYYIGPFEHNVFINTFGRSIGGLVEKMDESQEHPELILNISNYVDNNELLGSLKNDSETSEKTRVDINNQLLNKTMNIWYMATGTLIGIILIYYLYKYYKKSEFKTRSQSIELTNLNSDDDMNNYEELEIPEPKKKKKIWTKIIYYILFGGLILLFEYLFFQYVVLKYHIITDEQIQYLMFKAVKSYISNTYVLE